MWKTLLCAGLAVVLVACDEPLAVEFPGRIPTDQLNDPTLAPVLVNSVLGDFECAYSNYTGGSAVHSDEYETSNQNIPLANWGERTVTDALDDYVIGSCEGNFGIQRTLHTARYQAETVFQRLSAWTDAQVPNRTSLLATVRAYGAYTYLFMGETFCSVAFDGGPEQPPAAALATAEAQFAEAIALAQQAGNADILNMARVGQARVKMALKKWPEAAAAAGQVPAGYARMATRGADNTRRWNKLHRLANEQGAYVIATKYRPPEMVDPRVLVADAGRGSFIPQVRLWITTKYTTNASPIRIASYFEAQLILAEALAEQGQLVEALQVINTRRAALGLAPVDGATREAVVAIVISERQKELSFEGGHRLADLLRKSIPWKLGANPFTGRPYGATTCWPHPIKEIQGA